MVSLTFFDCLLHMAGLILLIFTAFSYATGLMHIAELADEYPTRTKGVLQYIIIGIIVLHLCLPIFTTLSYISVTIGVLAHLAYYKLTRTYPDIKLSSFWCVTSGILLVACQSAWYYEFRLSKSATQPVAHHYNSYGYNRSVHQNTQLVQYTYTTGDLVAFNLLLVWLVPLMYFVTCTVTDTTLPSTSPRDKQNKAAISDTTGKHKKPNQWKFSYKSLINWVLRRAATDGALPDTHSPKHTDVNNTADDSGGSRSNADATDLWSSSIASLPPRQPSYPQQRTRSTQSAHNGNTDLRQSSSNTGGLPVGMPTPSTVFQRTVSDSNVHSNHHSRNNSNGYISDSQTYTPYSNLYEIPKPSNSRSNSYTAPFDSQSLLHSKTLGSSPAGLKRLAHSTSEHTGV